MYIWSTDFQYVLDILEALEVFIGGGSTVHLNACYNWAFGLYIDHYRETLNNFNSREQVPHTDIFPCSN